MRKILCTIDAGIEILFKSEKSNPESHWVHSHRIMTCCSSDDVIEVCFNGV